jgi:hypothetical protein
MRPVKDGETLTGHGNPRDGYGEICVMDGIGHGGGSLICGIEGFHSVTVKIKDEATELCFENRFCIAIPGSPW